jgi:hypothetical protein
MHEQILKDLGILFTLRRLHIMYMTGSQVKDQGHNFQSPNLSALLSYKLDIHRGFLKQNGRYVQLVERVFKYMSQALRSRSIFQSKNLVCSVIQTYIEGF